ncbi:hypothetical protein MRB53_038132 [Persea americana]|nr:hypothetical protein MRB53_038132 [Persea americana]
MFRAGVENVQHRAGMLTQGRHSVFCRRGMMPCRRLAPEHIALPFDRTLCTKRTFAQQKLRRMKNHNIGSAFAALVMHNYKAALRTNHSLAEWSTNLASTRLTKRGRRFCAVPRWKSFRRGCDCGLRDAENS